jgi:molecular chaperone GrpE
MPKHPKTKENDASMEERNATIEGGAENDAESEAPSGIKEGEVRPDQAVSGKDDEIEAMKKELKQFESVVKNLTDENASLKDQYLRKAADYENFRKRMFREKDEAVLFANQNLIVDMVSIVDDLDRAIDSASRMKDFQTLFQGIEMTRKKFLGLLENKYSLKQFESIGKPFDHHVHEAVMMEHRDDVAEPTVVEEFMKGYLLNNRVIRTTKVKVAMPKVEAKQEPDLASNGESAPVEAE